MSKSDVLACKSYKAYPKSFFPKATIELIQKAICQSSNVAQFVHRNDSFKDDYCLNQELL